MESTTVYDGFCKVDILETPVGKRTRVRATDSVNVFIYDRGTNRVLLITQPNHAGAFRDDNPDGRLMETIAGRFDVNLGPKALAVKEALEEAGVRITEADVRLLNDGQPLYLSAGLRTERAYLAYAEVYSSMYETEERTFGASGEGEQIRRVWIPVDKLASLPCEDVRVFAFVQWFLHNKERETEY